MCYFSFDYVYWQITYTYSVASVQTLPKRDVLYTILLLFLQYVGMCIEPAEFHIGGVISKCRSVVPCAFHDDCLYRDVRQRRRKQVHLCRALTTYELYAFNSLSSHFCE